MSNSRLHCCFWLICVSICFPNCCHGNICQQERQPSLYIFGDSELDAGNNNYINTTSAFRANHWPYGETFFKYPTGRFSNGRLVPDFIAEYGKLPLILPYLHPGFHQYTYGANFASAGAGVLPETRRGFVLDLKTQLSHFKKVEKQLRHKLGDEEAHKLISRSLYLISIGSNDYPVFTTNATVLQSYSDGEYVNMVIGNLTSVIKEIYKIGGRKFGFRNVGPLGCSPAMRVIKAGNCSEEATAIVKLHNIALSKMLARLENQLEGFKYALTDYYTFLSKLMNNPSKYGFKEGKVACCGSGPYRGIPSCGVETEGEDQFELCDNVNEYVFFDYVHPTEKVKQMLSKVMWDGKGNGPYNLKALF